MLKAATSEVVTPELDVDQGRVQGLALWLGWPSLATGLFLPLFLARTVDYVSLPGIGERLLTLH